jgi:hypothetical protein
MNVINLCKNIINFEFNRSTNINSLDVKSVLLISKSIEDIKSYENIKKVCFITPSSSLSTSTSLQLELKNYKITNIEKIYDTDLHMIFFTHNSHIDDITFIIAGYTSKICNINRINCYMYGKFIQSTIDKHTEIDADNLKKANDNKYLTQLNMYNQMYNIHRVLDQVDTEYCIKNRSDEYYINMNEYISIMKNNNKLIINNLFLYGKDYYISDHLFGTNTKNFKEMINNLKDILEKRKEIDQQYISHTEKVFAIAYLYNRYTKHQLINDEKNIFSNNFFIYDCDKFDDYLFTTIHAHAAASIKFINNKYGKQKTSSIMQKYRIWIKKELGYTNEDQTELLHSSVFNTIRCNLMPIKKIEDIKF